MFEVFWYTNRNKEHCVRVECNITDDDGTESEEKMYCEGSVADCLLFISVFASCLEESDDEDEAQDCPKL